MQWSIFTGTWAEVGNSQENAPRFNKSPQNEVTPKI